MKKTLLNRISINKNICHGKPHIRGTRIMVQQILDLLASGSSPGEIIKEDFPDLSEQDIQACIAFASKLVKNELIEVYETELANAE